MTGRSTTVLLTAAILLSCGGPTGPGGSGGGRGGSGGTGGTGGSGGGGTAVVCNATNCSTGCCNGNVCEYGTDVTLCGKGAVACKACGNNQVCDATQKCSIEPERQWRIYPSTATVNASDNGAAWDSDGSPPDVQITMACPANGGASLIGGGETQSFNPGWSPSTSGCILKASELLSGGFLWSADDIDVIGKDAITAPTTTELTEADIVAGQKVLTGQGQMNSITWKLGAP